jgi:hypothetical protein
MTSLGVGALALGALWAIIQSWMYRGRKIKEIKNQVEARDEVAKTIDRMENAVLERRSFHIDRLLNKTK